MRRKRISIVAALAAAALFVSACGEDNDGRNQTPVPTATAVPSLTTTAMPTATAGPSLTPTELEEAHVRLIHGSPDAPDIDVLFDGAVVLTGVPYLTASDYLTVPAGILNVKVRATGTDMIALDFDLMVDADTDFTAVITDFLDTLNPFALIDDRALQGEGMTKLRIGHGAPSAPNVDVHLTSPGGELGDPVLADLPFQFFSDYLTIPSGDYQVRATAVGTSDVIIDTGAVTLDSNAVLTLIAFDAPGGGMSFTVEPFSDNAD